MKKIIPIYFAIDDNYAPYLVVTLQSIVDNSNKENFYKFYILNTFLSERNYNEIAKFNTDNTSIDFVDVTKYMDSFSDKLHLRDYYTNATYYRMFLPSIAKEYDKILYLDSDIIVLDDIANLFNHDINDNLVGAIVEDVMTNFDVFGTYVEKALGIDRYKFFNAGILVMNTKQFRELDIENKFLELISNFKFVVTQDEDYLNVLCKGRIKFIDEGWNRAPIPGTQLDTDKLKLIHYKITWKPWNYSDVMYEDSFWDYAKKTAYYQDLLDNRKNYPHQERDKMQFDKLVETANKDINDENNYCNTTNSNTHDVYEGINPKSDEEFDIDFPETLVPHRQEILKKIALHEKNGWFDLDVEDDGETIPLLPHMVDYTRKSLKSRFDAWFATKVAINFYEKQIKNKQFIIEEIKGLENVTNIKTGKVITCNHFSVFDNYAIYRPLLKSGNKKLYKVIREGNYTTYKGIFGYFFRNCNTLPLATNIDTMKKFFKGCKELLGNNETILIYPEQAMWYNYRKPRPLKEGAFRIAVNSNVPVIPAFITMKDSDLLDGNGDIVQKYTVHYLEPIYPKPELSKVENCEYMKKRNYEAWVKLYEEVYGEKLSYNTK